ncbi:MAG: NDP-sugar synthase [Desulfobacterales bacterium]|nr:NDP-sugar synthase [Desulfobacterales bacterium]
MRLRPLTANKPKPLLPIGNIPVINRTIQYLKGHGINKIIVNAHHRQEQIVKHLDGKRLYGIDIEVRMEKEILGTGGGLKNTEDFWDDEPFILINGDILTDIDLARAYKIHEKNRGLATLILHDHKSFNQIQIDDHLSITDIPHEKRPDGLAFTGIHIIEPEILACIQKGVFSNIIDCYRKLIRSGKKIRAHVSDGRYWRDIGTVESYVLANKEVLKRDSFLLGTGCRIHDSARLGEWAIIGSGADIKKRAEISRSVLWEDVRVKSGIKIVDSIVTSSKNVGHDLVNTIY